MAVKVVSTHSRLKAAGIEKAKSDQVISVSTHSRLKAAGRRYCDSCFFWFSFNTQPPEGGWVTQFRTCTFGSSFNTQPPEGGWQLRDF